MSFKNLTFEKDGSVGVIRVNRPEVRNVFNGETWMEFEAALKELHQDPELRVGIVTGTGGGKGPASIHIAKKAMFHITQLPFFEALKRDSELYGDVYRTEDFKEGVTAFLEKRKPVFKNR